MNTLTTNKRSLEDLPAWHGEAVTTIKAIIRDAAMRTVWLGIVLAGAKDRGKRDGSIPHGEFRDWCDTFLGGDLSPAAITQALAIGRNLIEQTGFELSDAEHDKMISRCGYLPRPILRAIENKSRTALLLEANYISDAEQARQLFYRGQWEFIFLCLCGNSVAHEDPSKSDDPELGADPELHAETRAHYKEMAGDSIIRCFLLGSILRRAPKEKNRKSLSAFKRFHNYLSRFLPSMDENGLNASLGEAPDLSIEERRLEPDVLRARADFLAVVFEHVGAKHITDLTNAFKAHIRTPVPI